MTDEKSPSYQELADYFCGDVSTKDVAVVERWLSDHPEEQDLLRKVHSSWRAVVETAPTSQSAEIQEIRRAVEARISAIPAPAGPNRQRQWRIGLPRVMTGIAAILLAVVGILVARADRSSSSPPIQAYRTLKGEQKTVRLADGSTIIVAPATSVFVAENAITVEGEAYFSVASSVARPFLVRTKNASVQVLGTRFAVRQYPSESTSRVVVDDGKVSVRSLLKRVPDDQAIVLSTRMMAQVADSGMTVTTDVDARDYTSWTEGRLVFRDTPLRDVVAELARAYGADIRISDSVLAGQPMTLKVFVFKESLMDVLSGIGLVTNAHYNREDHVFVVAPGHTALRAPHIRMNLQPEKSYGR